MAEILEEYQKFVDKQSQLCKTFKFWSSYMTMVEQLLDLIRATRTSDWARHVQVTRAMIPWYFSYDHQNYARYLCAYLMEMEEMPSTHPETHAAFIAGKWSVQRQTRYGFSATACDQTIENTINRDR